MIALQGNILLDFDIVDALENSQAVPHADNAHLLKIIVQQGNQSLADNLILCPGLASFQIQYTVDHS